MESCDECRFTYADLALPDVPAEVRRLAGELADVLAHGDVRRRPAPEVWSPLEYACHVRDVLAVQRERIGLALVEDCPDFVPMGREQLLVDRAYNDQDPALVAEQVRWSADAFALACEALRPDDWTRTGTYHWPETARRDLRWLARHTTHEVRHHLGDVRAQLG